MQTVAAQLAETTEELEKLKLQRQQLEVQLQQAQAQNDFTARSRAAAVTGRCQSYAFAGVHIDLAGMLPQAMTKGEFVPFHVHILLWQGCYHRTQQNAQDESQQ